MGNNVERIYDGDVFIGIIHEAEGRWYATVPMRHRRLACPTFRTDGNGLVRLPGKKPEPLTWNDKHEAAIFLHNFHRLRVEETMDATEAIVYCVGFEDDTPEDGEYHSRTVYDRNDQPHWIAWKDGSPRFCSESSSPFSESLSPYRY